MCCIYSKFFYKFYDGRFFGFVFWNDMNNCLIIIVKYYFFFILVIILKNICDDNGYSFNKVIDIFGLVFRLFVVELMILEIFFEV